MREEPRTTATLSVVDVKIMGGRGAEDRNTGSIVGSVGQKPPFLKHCFSNIHLGDRAFNIKDL